MKTIFLSALLVLVGSVSSYSQQWQGANNATSLIYRTGKVSVGDSNPPSDINSYVKTTNTKVGFASEAFHNQDFDFGMISAVNRNNSKAFTVFQGSNGNFTERFTIMGDGRVFASDVTVRTPIFPDYVFAKNYNLMAIDDLEQYILKYQHLPKVPSAKEVIDEGLSLGKMQVIQMEKIEELTLYIIQLQKQLKKLESRVGKSKTKKRRK